MSDHTPIQDIAIEAAKATPPLDVAGAHVVLGLSLADWVAVVTLIYLCLQMGLLVPRYRVQFIQWRKERRQRKKECRDRD